MDPISFVSPPSADSSADSSSRVGLSDNFDTFLSLLTSQLQNQDPLSPTDTTEFTNQITQFSQVEQQIRMNTQLEELIKSQRSNTASLLADYLGRDVEIGSDRFGFHEDPVRFSWELPSDAVKAKAFVHDGTGELVWSTELDVKSGRHELVWDGSVQSGGVAPEGGYRFSVQAEDADGESVSARIGVKSRVDGLDLSGEEPALITEAGIYGYGDAVRLVESAG